MASLFALPFLSTELTGANQIRFSVGASSYTATVTWSGKAYCYTRSADDLGAAVASAMTTASGTTFTASWDEQGRLVLSSNSMSTVTLLWTDAASTFDAQWIGYDASADISSSAAPSPATGQRLTAPWRGGRLFIPNRTIYSFLRPRRSVSLRATRGRKLSSRKHGNWHTQRPLFDNLPVVLLWADAANWDELAGLYPTQQGDPNLSLEASIWDPWDDAHMPLRFTPRQTDLDSYQELQVDPDNGGAEWLDNPETVVQARGGYADENAAHYRVGPMPWMEYQT